MSLNPTCAMDKNTTWDWDSTIIYILPDLSIPPLILSYFLCRPGIKNIIYFVHVCVFPHISPPYQWNLLIWLKYLSIYSMDCLDTDVKVTFKMNLKKLLWSFDFSSITVQPSVPLSTSAGPRLLHAKSYLSMICTLVLSLRALQQADILHLAPTFATV